MKTAKKIVVLDRDGVINHDSDAYVKSVDEWLPIEGSIEAIAQLKRAGYIVAVATNQSGIGRGYYSESVLEQMHDKMADLLMKYRQSIDLIVYCPHVPEDDCCCRKPKAGLLEQIATQLGIELADAYIVGDSLRDLQAGMKKSMRPVLVKTGKGVVTLNKSINDNATYALPKNTEIYDNLAEFVDALLN